MSYAASFYKVFNRYNKNPYSGGYLIRVGLELEIQKVTQIKVKICAVIYFQSLKKFICILIVISLKALSNFDIEKDVDQTRSGDSASKNMT